MGVSGCLIVEFVNGNRLVYKWSNLFIVNIARRRYITDQVHFCSNLKIIARKQTFITGKI